MGLFNKEPEVRYIIKFIGDGETSFASHAQVTGDGMAAEYADRENPVAFFMSRAEAEFVANGFRDVGTMIVEHFNPDGEGFKLVEAMTE